MSNRSYVENEEYILDSEYRIPNFSSDFKNQLENNDLFIILGMGGNGKTWLSMKQAYDMIAILDKQESKINKENYIPLTLFLNEINNCCPTEYLIEKISIHLNDKIKNKIKVQDFWSFLKMVNLETKGVVFFIDDLGNQPQKCENFDRELSNFLKTAIMLGSKIIINSRPVNFYMRTSLLKDEIFGIPAKIYNLPLFSIDEAFELWERKKTPQVYELYEYIKNNRFLCHPLILSLTIDQSLKKGKWLPSYKFEVFEILLYDLFKQSVNLGIFKESQKRDFIKYIVDFANSIFTQCDDEFNQIPELHSFLIKYHIFYSISNMEEKYRFFHDTFYAYLLMLKILPTKNKLLKLTSNEMEVFAKKLWEISLENEFALEIIEFSILQLLNLNNKETDTHLEDLINCILDYSTKIKILTREMDNKVVLLMYYIGNILRENSYYTEAEKCYKISISNFCTFNFKPLNNLGTLLMDQNKYPQAIDVLKLAVEQQLFDFRIFLNLGTAFKKNGDDDKAIISYKKSLTIYPFEPETWFSLGNVYGTLKNYKFGLDCFQKAIELNSKSPKYWTFLGITQFEMNMIDEGINSLEKALEFDKDFEIAIIELGKNLILQNKKKEGIAKIESLLKKNSISIDILEKIGLVYLTILSDNKKAAEIFSRVLNLEKTANAYTNLGLALLRQGKLDEAKKYTSKAIDIEPTNYFAINNLSVIFRFKGDYDKSIHFAKNALSLNKEFGEAYLSLGLALQFSSKLDIALINLKKALKFLRKDNDLFEAYFNIAVIYLQRDDFNNTLQYINKALEIFPDNSLIINLNGLFYFKKQEYKKAKDLIEKAINKNPKNPSFYYNLGNIYFIQGDFDNAVIQFEKAVNIDPENLKFLNNLTASYEKIGDRNNMERCKKIMESLKNRGKNLLE